MEYIIVQAGGKGTRLKQHTANKPKALVPVDNLPMIFHLFRKFPQKRFIIIGDYKKEVMEKYLRTFAKISYLMVDASGNEGTCAGIRQALKLIPQNKSFMIIWSDLILPESFKLPLEEENWIGISKGFSCRWSYSNGVFSQTPSDNQGVAGVFIFRGKKELLDVPESGEFVKWLKQAGIIFQETGLYSTREYGLEETIVLPKTGRCRPFNRITVQGDCILKEGIDEQGKELAIREKAWYRHCLKVGFKAIPKIYNFDPFRMEKINGKNVFEYQLSGEEKKQVLQRIMDNLGKLHSLQTTETDYFSMWQAYFIKTMDRLQNVRDLIPFSDEREIVINGRNCRNVFFCQRELAERIKDISCERFCLIHGDCTFSNILLREDLDPVFIDPRGYFGNTQLLGDPLYDWAKIYYSLRGNYDQFNLKRFTLDIKEEGIALEIASNCWEDMEDIFLSFLDELQRKEIKLIHAIIWLSLTTYAWEDYDSVCGAFYNGLYYLEEIL